MTANILEVAAEVEQAKTGPEAQYWEGRRIADMSRDELVDALQCAAAYQLVLSKHTGELRAEMERLYPMYVVTPGEGVHLLDESEGERRGD